MEDFKPKIAEAFPRAEKAVIDRIGSHVEQRLRGPVYMKSKGKGQQYELSVIQNNSGVQHEIHYESSTGVISYREQRKSTEEIIYKDMLGQVTSP